MALSKAADACMHSKSWLPSSSHVALQLELVSLTMQGMGVETNRRWTQLARFQEAHGSRQAYMLLSQQRGGEYRGRERDEGGGAQHEIDLFSFRGS